MKSLVAAAVLFFACSAANAQYFVMPGHGYTQPIPQPYYGGYYYNPGYSNYIYGQRFGNQERYWDNYGNSVNVMRFGNQRMIRTQPSLLWGW